MVRNRSLVAFQLNSNPVIRWFDALVIPQQFTLPHEMTVAPMPAPATVMSLFVDGNVSVPVHVAVPAGTQTTAPDAAAFIAFCTAACVAFAAVTVQVNVDDCARPCATHRVSRHAAAPTNANPRLLIALSPVWGAVPTPAVSRVGLKAGRNTGARLAVFDNILVRNTIERMTIWYVESIRVCHPVVAAALSS